MRPQEHCRTNGEEYPNSYNVEILTMTQWTNYEVLLMNRNGIVVYRKGKDKVRHSLTEAIDIFIASK